MDESRFQVIADKTLHDLMDDIEAALGDRLDVDLDGGVLTIELDTGEQYVLNKHAPTRQIWMSSPVSGATHFAHREGVGWVATRGGEILEQMLASELSALAGIRVTL